MFRMSLQECNELEQCKLDSELCTPHLGPLLWALNFSIDVNQRAGNRANAFINIGVLILPLYAPMYEIRSPKGAVKEGLS